MSGREYRVQLALALQLLPELVIRHLHEVLVPALAMLDPVLDPVPAREYNRPDPVLESIVHDPGHTPVHRLPDLAIPLLQQPGLPLRDPG
jgi:hypothetical protein